MNKITLINTQQETVQISNLIKSFNGLNLEDDMDVKIQLEKLLSQITITQKQIKFKTNSNSDQNQKEEHQNTKKNKLKIQQIQKQITVRNQSSINKSLNCQQKSNYYQNNCGLNKNFKTFNIKQLQFQYLKSNKIQNFTQNQIKKYIQKIAGLQKKVILQQKLDDSQRSDQRLGMFIKNFLLPSITSKLQMHTPTFSNKINFKLLSQILKALKICFIVLKQMDQDIQNIILQQYPIISHVMSTILNQIVMQQNQNKEFKQRNKSLIMDILFLIVTRIQVFDQNPLDYDTDYIIAIKFLKHLKDKFLLKQQGSKQNKAQRDQLYVSSILFTICYICQSSPLISEQLYKQKIHTKALVRLLLRKQSKYSSKILIDFLNNLNIPIPKNLLQPLLKQIFKYNPHWIAELLKYFKSQNNQKCIPIILLKIIKLKNQYALQSFLSANLKTLQISQTKNTNFIWLIRKLIQNNFIISKNLFKYCYKFDIQASTMQMLSHRNSQLFQQSKQIQSQQKSTMKDIKYLYKQTIKDNALKNQQIYQRQPRHQLKQIQKEYLKRKELPKQFMHTNASQIQQKKYKSFDKIIKCVEDRKQMKI